MIQIQGNQYEIIENFREAFKEDVFKERYSDILNKYDYIVGDWGYNQLRLRGFYDDDQNKAPFDKKISTLQDYLYEYCNFGCPYFVLGRRKA
ncbi:YutD family protein [Aureibacillus halotolerans]|uniref:Uncharacterized protein YutD n=1 Tax=Aureibacillus halotolerans TaxID=1508390 RepID=A0A4R6U6F2_9BACI|nr:uncharacterized protein YutD [Aureibacillus halotolerans]